MRYTDIDRRIESLAARQFGVFSRQQAFDLGASERFVKRRLQDKHWQRPVPAVYTLTTSAGTWKRQCKIAELSIDDAAIAGFFGGGVARAAGFRPGRIELLAPVNSYCTHPFATIHRYAGAALDHRLTGFVSRRFPSRSSTSHRESPCGAWSVRSTTRCSARRPALPTWMTG